MLTFSPDVKFFFSVSKAFLKEYPVILILIPEQKNGIVCIVHLLLYKIMIHWGFFLTWIRGSGPDKIMRIRADPDPKDCLVESHFYKSWLTILILGTTASLRP